MYSKVQKSYLNSYKTMNAVQLADMYIYDIKQKSFCDAKGLYIANSDELQNIDIEKCEYLTL